MYVLSCRFIWTNWLVVKQTRIIREKNALKIFPFILADFPNQIKSLIIVKKNIQLLQ